MKNAIAFASALAALSATLNTTREPAELPAVHTSLDAGSIPRTLDECFVVLAKMLPAETLAQMKRAPEADMIEYHHGLGTWMRNHWGLWARGPLYRHFQDLGLEHPDDMSGVILNSFWRYLHDHPLEVEQQVQGYQAYWRVAKPPDASSNPLCPSGIEVMLSLHREFPDGSPRMIHMGRCCPGRPCLVIRDRPWLVFARQGAERSLEPRSERAMRSLSQTRMPLLCALTTACT